MNPMDWKKMSWNDKFKFLYKTFDASMSSDPEIRHRGEAQLSEASEYINYGITLIEFVTETHFEKIFRETAAKKFRSYVESRWFANISPQASDPSPQVISEREKKQLRSLIIHGISSSTDNIQLELIMTLLFIAGKDFTTSWPDMIHDLGIRLQEAGSKSDFISMNGILGAVDRLLMTICDNDSFTLSALQNELEFCADQFVEFFIPIFSSNSSNLLDLGLKPLIEAQIFCYGILNSLFHLGVPDSFMDIKDEWIAILIRDLNVKVPGDLMILADRLCTSIFEMIVVLMETELDIFIDQHLKEFVNVTLNLLPLSSKSSSRDGLTVAAMEFLTMVKGSNPHLLFERDDYVQHLCQFIVIPNVMLRKVHEELFNMDHLEFIDKDMEGCGLDRRRYLACELVNVTDHRYKRKVLETVLNQISTYMELYNQDPDKFWKHKECTIFLVVSLAEKGADGSALSSNLVAVENFFSSYIIPELRRQDIKEFSMLKAGALKFFIVFRNQILKPTALTLIPDVVRLLNSDSNVVHSYAATCIEKLLRVKGDGAYTAVDICPYLMELTCNLFKALEKKDSEENKYVMACIMRVLGVADISDELACRCLSRLALFFNRVCEYPKNSVFNCYLFEAIAVFLRRVCEKRYSLVPTIEESLLPSLLKILDDDIVEFVPYALQLLSPLVELNNAPIPLSYTKVFDALKLYDSSERPESVHRARAQLLQSFLVKAPYLLEKEMWLDRFLLIVNKLVRSRKSEKKWFYVLNTIIENFEYDVLEPRMVHIWTMIFSRVSARKTEKLCKCIVIFMSLFLVKYGSENFVLSTNAADAGMFLTIIESIWIPTLRLIEGPIKIKLTSIASTRLIFDSSFLDTITGARWGMMLDSIVTLLSLPEQDNVEEVNVPNFEETVGYNSEYACLYNSVKKEKDPLGDISDAKLYLVALLERKIPLSPTKYHQLIVENLEQANQAALLRFCGSAIGKLFNAYGM